MPNIRKALRIIIKLFLAILMGSLIGILVALFLFIAMIPFGILIELFLYDKYNFNVQNMYKIILATSIFLGQIIGLCTCMYLEFKVNN
ncbi:hypothetical protein [Nostoc sp.]|uniref:hypothetical protein n=1 Tax=Nostoc sp. TaxID=1180 RepID=UPI002FF489A7